MTQTRAAGAPVGARTISSVFAAAINSGDLHGAGNCFTRDACLLTPDQTAVHGRDQIRAVLAQLIDRQVKIEILASFLLLAGDLALGAERWRLRTIAADGTDFEQISHPTLIARCSEGDWRLAIATPWGWGRAPQRT
jgi:ketosteroid isomerase-like protein